MFNDQISQLIALLNEKTEFYHNIPDAHNEAKQRFQQFMADAAAFHTKEETDQPHKPQFPVTCKILSRVFDKWGNVAGHVVHDCPE